MYSSKKLRVVTNKITSEKEFLISIAMSQTSMGCVLSGLMQEPLLISLHRGDLNQTDALCRKVLMFLYFYKLFMPFPVR